ncbi:uncharacterized protein MONOS_4467 [Monocercomonoides exilis]|uniref:uncharacterized protein n=1 Tax=Monocercomonoides exilis TaxID=2049356 RepID=UPI003559E2C7|nr:hypothetical protein MONOS_4467 [Monocercomonoides exilis]|eukprot:MONOS_4467.1-p1 / transcript=MONOS_4467.1 / gene=MONOS_4467 / organism=Monocercomonoides_exilis_PA203 / gene_product=unspecified product / transcript_product=unspecified product / location=Mono_scaffold00119:29147-30688(+) / protein_length=459 / sequence_SO=supercontig / SO=protein_coding / is_pseudo=false
MFSVRNICNIRDCSSPSITGTIVQKPKLELNTTTHRSELRFVLADSESNSHRCQVLCLGSFAEENEYSFEAYDSIDVHPSYIKWETEASGEKMYILVLDDTYQTTYPDGGKVGLFLLKRINVTPGINEVYQTVPFEDLFAHVGKRDVSIVGLVEAVSKPTMIKTKRGRGVEKQDVTLQEKGMQIVLSCWGEKGTVMRGLHAGESIVHVTNVGVSVFAGKVRCNTSMNSIITLNPSGFSKEMFMGNEQMKGQDSIAARSLPFSSQSSSYASSSSSYPSKSSAASAQLTTIQGIQEYLAPLVGHSATPTSGSQQGAVMVCLEDIDLTRPFFLRCASCKKTIHHSSISATLSSSDSLTSLPDLSSLPPCSSCGASPSLALKVTCCFVDHTGSLSTTLFSEVAATLIGYTADQLSSFDTDKREEIRSELLWRRFYVEFSLYAKDGFAPLQLSVKSATKMNATL